jgi:hypothetical protein
MNVKFAIISLLTATALVFAPFLKSASVANISRCGDLDSYKVVPYLDVAVELQSMRKEDAIALLQKWAKSPKHDGQVIILCRMLFEAKKGAEFRSPLLGGPQFNGGTTMMDWPLEPITIVDDIPFVIVLGYFLAGQAEEAPSYLSYCLSNAEWTSRHYHIARKREINAALQKLLKSSVWKHRLDEWEMGMLRKQIE